jgi:hypothetical protein
VRLTLARGSKQVLYPRFATRNVHKHAIEASALRLGACTSLSAQ